MQLPRRALFLLQAAALSALTSAWAPHFLAPRSSTIRFTARVRDGSALFMADTVPSDAAQGTEMEKLTDDEFEYIQNLYNEGKESGLTEVMRKTLPGMAPNVIMKLRQTQLDSREEFKAVSKALEEILDSRLNTARDTLQGLLSAGEIRKLDSMIGNAARQNDLDVAFFQVLNMNLQDAAKAMEESGNTNPLEDANANRFQVLQHIYTRCQEEVEKTIPPGVALLNKLMRTEQSSIRTNQLNHFLCPQPKVIKTPDGKELELEGRDKILVEHKDFVEAIGSAVQQIRTVEKAGGASPEVSAGMVESCRQVAREARVVIGTHFGEESEELRNFESDLQPVFRPSSPDSLYIQGVAAAGQE